jgi:hypothetical protein
MSRADRFNATTFSAWVNGPSGRAFRLGAGVAWLVFGLLFRGHWWATAAARVGLVPPDRWHLRHLLDQCCSGRATSGQDDPHRTGGADVMTRTGDWP